MEKQSSLMLRLSQHLEPSSTVGTKAQAECHLPGMLKQELLFRRKVQHHLCYFPSSLIFLC